MQFKEFEHSDSPASSSPTIQNDFSYKDVKQLNDSQRRLQTTGYELPEIAITNIGVAEAQTQKPATLDSLSDSQLKALKDGFTKEVIYAELVLTKDKATHPLEDLRNTINANLNGMPEKLEIEQYKVGSLDSDKAIYFDPDRPFGIPENPTKVTVDLPLKADSLSYMDTKDGVSVLMLKVTMPDGTPGRIEVSQFPRCADAELRERINERNFHKADRNSDGQIDSEEFDKEVDKTLALLMGQWDKGGAKLSKQLDWANEEYNRAEQAFKNMSGADKRISKDEYMNSSYNDRYWITAANQPKS